VVGEGETTEHRPMYEMKTEEVESIYDMNATRYKQSRQKNLQLIHNGYTFCRDTNRGNRAYWRCRFFRNGKCGARLITIDDKIVSESRVHTHEPEESQHVKYDEVYEEVL
jgi:hypothetical protein